MATIDSVLRLKLKQLEKDLHDISVEKVAPLMDMDMRKAVMDSVYSTPESIYYNRTFGLLNSVTTDVIKSGDGLTISVFNDPSLMDDPHSSWVSATDERKNIPMWIARGHKGIVHYTPSNYDILTYQNLVSEKKYLKLIKQGLKQKGYTVK